MASRNSMQKQRSSGEREKARASGGGLRSQPTEGMPGRSASTGGATTRGMARDHDNSRSSNSGRPQRRTRSSKGNGT